MKDNDSGFSIVEVVLVLAIVVLIAAVGYLVYKNNHKSTTTSSTTGSTTTKSSTAKTTTTPDPYAGWSGYTGAAHLFTVKYPKGWTANSIQDQTDTPYPLADHVVTLSAPNPSNAASPTEVNVIAYSTGDLQGVLSKDAFGEKQTSPQSTTINGYQALYNQDIEDGSDGTNPTYTEDDYALTHNGITVLFSFTEVQGNDENIGTATASGGFDHTSTLPTFNLIVKSIEFLN